jgi:sulfatase modifying factor 1
VKSQGHSISFYLVFAVALGVAAFFVACSGSSGGSAAKACDVVGATEACTCFGGLMGERVCGDDMTFGGCLGCPEPQPTVPDDGKCYRCLNDDPWAVECSEIVDRTDGTRACIAGDDVEACSTLSQCCMALGREATSAGSCVFAEAGAGESCATGSDCESTLCAQLSDQRICVEQCDNGMCGEGFRCTSNVCVPAGGAGAGGGIEFIRIEGGSFQMGGEGEFDGRPIHGVDVATFEMSKTEVTMGQYRQCVSAGACTEPSGRWENVPGVRENHPVTYVKWHQAKAFAEFADARLPTEAEWEYAAKSGGQDIVYPWGNEEPNCDRLNFNECVGDTTPVCTYATGNTAQGLCDMAGNVWEWVEDDRHGSYEGAPVDGSAWVDNPRGSFRVLRGGSWIYGAFSVRAAFRDFDDPSHTGVSPGFRLARSAP